MTPCRCRWQHPQAGASLWEGLEDGVHLLGHCCQRKLELLLEDKKGSP